MIVLFAAIVICAIIGAVQEDRSFGDPLEGAAGGAAVGLLVGLVLNVFVAILWGGVNAHYTDITSKIEQKVVNNEAVFQFTTSDRKNWSLPTNETIVNTGDKAQIITYTASDASIWWTIFPNGNPQRSPQLVIPVP